MEDNDKEANFRLTKVNTELNAVNRELKDV